MTNDFHLYHDFRLADKEDTADQTFLTQANVDVPDQTQDGAVIQDIAPPSTKAWTQESAQPVTS